MTSAAHGSSISPAELQNVSASGFWLLIDGEELFLPFDQFPWFREASIRQISTIERPSTGHLRWPELDIDLAVDSIRHPERYPLLSKAHRD